MKKLRRNNNKKAPVTLVLLRFLAIPIILLLLVYKKFDLALILFIIFPFVGFLDTFLEKYRKAKSKLREIFDVLVDKLLIDVVAIALVALDMLPFWVMAVFVGRDLIAYVGSIIFLIKDKVTVIRPTILGKFALFFQLITLALAINGIIDYTLIWIAVGFTIASFIHMLFKSEFIILKKSKELESFKMSKLIGLADLVTLINVVFGFMVILFAINKSYLIASIMMLLAVFFDWLDGKVARALKKASDFGKELDSLADTISFGVAPAIFGFSLIQTKLAVVAFVIFIFCGILRLARYNISGLKGVYQGMPITLNGIIIPIIYFSNLNIAYYPYVFLILGILMISPIRVSKIF